jgi:protocatechuate 3,4-dioxygenase alpha subunit
MTQEFVSLKESASQTAGPYVQMGLTPNFAGVGTVYDEDLGSNMINERTKGERIVVTGRVIDGIGAPIKDAVIEIWQADAHGLYNSPVDTRAEADPNFTGWGRCSVDPKSGVFSFATVKPGKVPFLDGSLMAPHITFWIVARGINLGLHTRMYFGDENAANDEDPVLQRIEHGARAATLIAQREGSAYHFDIHLQGDRETVFFDI